MNREIKFRGKYLYNGEWGFGSLLKIEDNYHIVDETVMCEDGHHIRQERDIPTWVKPDTIGQFTGLYANGKEIYEGDILKVECTDGSSICKLVRFMSEKGAFCMANTFELCHEKRWDIWYCMSQKWINEMETIVIGNIHDNPELLNGTS